MKTNTTDKHHILKTMQNYGGGFASALAQAAMRADDNNYWRLKNAFPEIWAQTAEIAQRLTRRTNNEDERL